MNELQRQQAKEGEGKSYPTTTSRAEAFPHQLPTTASTSLNKNKKVLEFLPDWELLDIMVRNNSSNDPLMMSSSSRPKMECVCASKECSGVTAVFKVLQDKRGCFVELPPTEMERTLMMLEGDAFALPTSSSGSAAQTSWQLRQCYLRHLHVPDDVLEDDMSYFVALHHFHPQVVQDSHVSENDDRLAIVCRTVHESSWKALYLSLKDQDRIPGTEGSYFVVPNYPFIKAKEDAQKAFQKFRLKQQGGSSRRMGDEENNSLPSRHSKRSTSSSLNSMPVAIATSPYTSSSSSAGIGAPMSLSVLKAAEQQRRRMSTSSSSVNLKHQHARSYSNDRSMAASTRSASSSSQRRTTSSKVPSPKSSGFAAATATSSTQVAVVARPANRGMSMPWTRLIYQPKDNQLEKVEDYKSPSSSSRRGRDPRPSTVVSSSSSSKRAASEQRKVGGGFQALRRSLSRGRGDGRRGRSESAERGGGFFRRRGRSGSNTRLSQNVVASAMTTTSKNNTSVATSASSRAMASPPMYDTSSHIPARSRSLAPVGASTVPPPNRYRQSLSPTRVSSKNDSQRRGMEPYPMTLLQHLELTSRNGSKYSTYEGPVDLDESVDGCNSTVVTESDDLKEVAAGATKAVVPSASEEETAAEDDQQPPQVISLMNVPTAATVAVTASEEKVAKKKKSGEAVPIEEQRKVRAVESSSSKTESIPKKTKSSSSTKSKKTMKKPKPSPIVRQSSDGSVEVDLDALFEQGNTTSGSSCGDDGGSISDMSLHSDHPASNKNIVAEKTKTKDRRTTSGGTRRRSSRRREEGSERVDLDAAFDAAVPVVASSSPEDATNNEVDGEQNAYASATVVNQDALEVVFTEAALAEAAQQAQLEADNDHDSLFGGADSYVSGGDMSGFEPEPTTATTTSSSTSPHHTRPDDVAADNDDLDFGSDRVMRILTPPNFNASSDDDSLVAETANVEPSSGPDATAAPVNEDGDVADSESVLEPAPTTASSELPEDETVVAAVAVTSAVVASSVAAQSTRKNDKVAPRTTDAKSNGEEEPKYHGALQADDSSERSGNTAAATESVSSVQDSTIRDSNTSSNLYADNEDSEVGDEDRYVCNPYDDDVDESMRPLEDEDDDELNAAKDSRSTNLFDHAGLSPPVSTNPFDDEPPTNYSRRSAQTPSPSKKTKNTYSSPNSDQDVTETTVDSTDWDSSVPSPGSDSDDFWSMEDDIAAAKSASTLSNSRMNLFGLTSHANSNDRSADEASEGKIQEYRLPEELKPLKELSEQPVDRSESIAVFAAIEAKRAAWAKTELRGFKEQWNCYKDLIPVMSRETEWVEDLLKSASKSMEGYTDMIKGVAADSLLDETDRIIADHKKRAKMAAKRLKETPKFVSDTSVMQPVLDMLLQSVEQLVESVPSLSSEVESMAELSMQVSTRGNDLAKAGDRLMLDMEYVETKIRAAWAHLENVDLDLEGNEDHWLAEASYRNTVREGSALFKAHYLELMKVCDSIISLDEERRNRTKEMLLSFLPRRRRLFLRVLETSHPSISTLEEGRVGRDEISLDVDQVLEHLTRQSLTKQKRSRSSILNRSLTNKLDLKMDLDLAVVEKSNLFDSMHVKELRAVEAKASSKAEWQLSLAILTHDGFLHIVYCDLPESQLQEFHASHARAEVFLASKCEGRIPEISLPLFDCRSSMSSDKEFIQITCDGTSPLQKMLKRKVFVRLGTSVETTRWFEAHDAFWSRQGEEAAVTPQVTRV